MGRRCTDGRSETVTMSYSDSKENSIDLSRVHPSTGPYPVKTVSLRASSQGQTEQPHSILRA